MPKYKYVYRQGQNGHIVQIRFHFHCAKKHTSLCSCTTPLFCPLTSFLLISSSFSITKPLQLVSVSVLNLLRSRLHRQRTRHQQSNNMFIWSNNFRWCIIGSMSVITPTKFTVVISLTIVSVGSGILAIHLSLPSLAQQLNSCFCFSPA